MEANLVLVLVLGEWIDFKDYVERWGYLVELVYRQELTEHAATRLKIMAGRYGLNLLLEKGDPTLQEVKEFLKEHNAKRLDAAMDPLQFFS